MNSLHGWISKVPPLKGALPVDGCVSPTLGVATVDVGSVEVGCCAFDLHFDREGLGFNACPYSGSRAYLKT